MQGKDLQGKELHSSEHIGGEFVALDRRNLTCNVNFVEGFGRIFEVFSETET